MIFHCMNSTLFIHLSINGYLSYSTFCFLWRVLLWTFMYYLCYKFLCGHGYAFSSLGYIPRSGIPGSYSHLCFPGGASGKEPACQCKKCKRRRFDPWVRKIPWRRACNPLQYSCLENPMDRGAWWATVHRVAKSQAQLKGLSTYAW